MSDDVIYRQAAIDALMPIYKSASLRNRNVFSTARKCMAAIEDLPSAQPEIVRCKDCKNYIDHNCYEHNHINIGLFVHDNNYCGWAERRTDE